MSRDVFVNSPNVYDPYPGSDLLPHQPVDYSNLLPPVDPYPDSPLVLDNTDEIVARLAPDEMRLHLDQARRPTLHDIGRVILSRFTHNRGPEAMRTRPNKVIGPHGVHPPVRGTRLSRYLYQPSHQRTLVGNRLARP